eukprot:184526_1
MFSPADSLGFGNNPIITSLLKKQAKSSKSDKPETTLFSGDIRKINKRGKNQRRCVLLTNLAFYNLVPGKNFKCKRRIPIEIISSVSSSSLQLESGLVEMVLHVAQEHDYMFRLSPELRLVLIKSLRAAYSSIMQQTLTTRTIDDGDLAQYTDRSKKTTGVLKGNLAAWNPIIEKHDLFTGSLDETIFLSCAVEIWKGNGSKAHLRIICITDVATYLSQDKILRNGLQCRIEHSAITEIIQSELSDEFLICTDKQQHHFRSTSKIEIVDMIIQMFRTAHGGTIPVTKYHQADLRSFVRTLNLKNPKQLERSNTTIINSPRSSYMESSVIEAKFLEMLSEAEVDDETFSNLLSLPTDIKQKFLSTRQLSVQKAMAKFLEYQAEQASFSSGWLKRLRDGATAADVRALRTNIEKALQVSGDKKGGGSPSHSQSSSSAVSRNSGSTQIESCPMWVGLFIAGEGLTALIDLADRELGDLATSSMESMGPSMASCVIDENGEKKKINSSSLMLEVLWTIKTFADHDTLLVEDLAVLRPLADWVRCGNSVVISVVLEVLSVVAWTSEGGLAMVRRALADSTRQESDEDLSADELTLRPLMNLLSADDRKVGTVNTVFTFIQAVLVGLFPQPSKRVHMRECLRKLGLHREIDSMLSWATQNPLDAAFKNLSGLIMVYQKEMDVDRAEQRVEELEGRAAEQQAELDRLSKLLREAEVSEGKLKQTLEHPSAPGTAPHPSGVTATPNTSPLPSGDAAPPIANRLAQYLIAVAPTPTAPPPGGAAPPPGGTAPPPGGTAPPPGGAAPPPGGTAPPTLGGPPPIGFVDKPCLPPKPTIIPSVKMRPLQWQPVPTSAVAKTVWRSWSDELVQLDCAELEQFFGVADKHKNLENKVAEKRKNFEGDYITVLDPNRSRNVTITISRIFYSPDEIRSILLGMDQSVDEETLTRLCSCAPTPEEAQSLLEFDGDKSKLAPPDTLFLKLASIPNVKRRVEMWRFTKTFDSHSHDLNSSLDALSRAFKGIRNSNNLRAVFELILGIGNYVNGNTRKGGAYGFKLSSLRQIAGTKSTKNPKMSMLMYISRFVRAKHPKIQGFLDDLAMVEEASKVEEDSIRADARELLNGVRSIEQLCGAQFESGDRFPEYMKPFLGRVKKQMEELQIRIDGIQENADAVIEMFGELKCKWESILRIFSEFIKEYRIALRNLDSVEAEEIHDKKRKSFLRNMKERKVQKQSSSSAGDNDIVKQPRLSPPADQRGSSRIQKPRRRGGEAGKKMLDDMMANLLGVPGGTDMAGLRKRRSCGGRPAGDPGDLPAGIREKS